MTGSLSKNRLAAGLFAAMLTASVLVPVSAGAAYDPPVDTDTYMVHQTLHTEPVIGAGMMPVDFDRDINGNYWIAEADWSGADLVSRIAVYDQGGQMIGSFGQSFHGGDRLSFITAMEFGPDGYLYVADAGNRRIAIFNPGDQSFVGQIPQDGTIAPATLQSITDSPTCFGNPTDLDFDSNGNLYVVDSGYNRVVKFDAGLQPAAQWGSVNTASGDGEFYMPSGLYVSEEPSATYVYVADTYNDRVQKFTSDGTYASQQPVGTGDSPYDVYVDEYGVTYVTEAPLAAGGLSQFQRFDAAGQDLNTYASTPDGSLYASTRIVVDQDGSVWINDRISEGAAAGVVRRFGLNAGEPDTVPPVTTSNAPVGWTKGPVNLTLSAVDASTSVAATYYSTDGGEPHAAYTGTITVSAEGTNTLKYYSVDRVLNREVTKTDVIMIDNTSPDSTSSAQPIYYGSSVITFTATDDRAGVQNVYWRRNGLGPYNDPSVHTSIPGTYTLEFYAVDNAGNQEPSNFTTFVVRPPDSDPPLTTWMQNRGTEWFTEDTSITLEAVDTVSGVKSTYLGIDGAPVVPYTTPLSWSSEGTHTLTYWSVDNLDHVEQTRTATLKLDKGEPHSSAFAPAGRIGSATVTFEASDTVSGVERVEWRLDGTATWTVGYEAPVNTHGNFTLWYRAIDNAGNIETPHTVQISVIEPDYNAPTTIANIPDSGWVKGTPTRHLNLTANDDLSGVRATYFSVNGGAWQTYDPGTSYFAQGVYNISYYSVDNQDNVEGVKSGILRVDATAPTTTSDAQPFYSGPAEVHLTSHDEQSGASPRWRLDGGATQLGSTINLNEYKNYTLEYWSVDNAGIEETPHNFIDIAVSPPDTEPPITTFTGPTGWQKGSAQFSLSAWDASSTIKSTQYKVNGAFMWSGYFSPLTLTTEGTNTIEYYSTDFFNNAETPKTGYLHIDGSAPITTSDALTSYTEQAVLTLTPTDSYSGVSFTEYRINGGAWQTGTQAIVNWTRVRRYHTVEWRSYDNVNNIENIKSATFEVKLSSNAYGSSDSKIVYRDNWYSAYSGDVRESSTASDFALFAFQGTRLDLMSRRGPGMGQMRVTLLDTTMTPTVVDLNDGSERDGNSNNPNWTTGDMEFGDYVVKLERLTARVNIDDIRVDGQLIQVPDTAAPVTTVTAPPVLGTWGEGPVSVTLSSSDATTGVKAIYATSNGATPTIVNTYTAPVQVSAEGVNSVRFFAVDSRGNTETIKSATVKIDNTPPVTNSNAQASYTGTASVALLPNDPYSGVAYTKYRIDGGAWTTGTAPTIAAGQLGAHTIEWYSVDNLGHVETTKSATFTVLKRFEQTEPTVYWKGTWGVTTNAGLSGGSFKTSSVPGAAAYLTFTGTQIDWITSKNTTYGKARLTLDHNAPVEVDLYGGFAFKQKVWSSGPIADGTHTLMIEYSGSKNASSTGYTVGIDAFDIVGELVADSAAPVTSDDAPSAWRTTSATVTLTAADANSWVGSTRYSINGGVASTYTVPFAVSAEGTTTIEYASTDGAGNVETTKNAMVRIDRTAPAVSAQAPDGWIGSPAVVTLAATDAGSGVSQLLYSTDGSEPSLPYAEDLAISTQGTTTVRFKAVDALGNTSAVSSVTVTVDDDAPTSSDDAPTGWVDAPVDVTLSSTDTVSGVAAIVYRIDGGAETTYTGPIHVADEGTTSIEYRAVDVKGNAEGWKSTTVRVDMSAPVTGDDAPAGWVGTPVVVTLTPTDSVSAVQATFYSLDGSFPSLPYQGPIAIGSQGSTTLRFFSVDQAGNAETIVDRTILIDDDAPTSSDDAPTGWVDAPVDVTLSSTDTVSGVAAIVYRIDGGAETTYTGPIHVADEGVTSIDYRAIDVKGNPEGWKSTEVRLDMSAPVTTSNAQAAYNTSATISLTATDPLSGVGSTSYRLDNGGWTVGTVVNVLTGGTHTIEWYSVDALGHVETTKSATFTVLKRFEQTEPSVYWKGTWGTTTNAGLSGGSFKTSASSGAAAYLTFTGSQIDWITSRNTTYGKARLTLDGGVPVDVDLYGSFAFKQKVWTSGPIADGTHTLRIEYTGSKNASSTGYTVGVDAFDIVGELTPDAAAPVTADDAPGAWRTTPVTVTLTATDANTWVSGTRYSTNGGAATTYTAPFAVSGEGTTTIAYASTDGAGNVETTRSAMVRIDRTAPIATADAPGGWVGSPAVVTLSAIDSGSGVAQILYSTDGSEPTLPYSEALSISNQGATTVRYKAVDALGNGSSVSSVTVTVDDDAPSVTASAPVGWTASPALVTLSAADDLSGVAEILYSTDGTGPSLAYTGPIEMTQGGTHTVQYRARDAKGNVSSVASVQVSVDTLAPTTSSNAGSSYTGTATITLTASDTASGVDFTEFRLDGGAWTRGTSVVTTVGGVHNLEFRSTDRVGNVEETRQAQFSVTRRVEQTDGNLVFLGSWTTQSNGGFSAGNYRFTNTIGSSANVAFDGTRIKWVTSKSPTNGHARVTLDGGTPVTVDLYSSSGQFQQTVWDSGILPNGRHTLRIEWTGSKNTSATGFNIGIDAFDLTGSLVFADGLPPTTVATGVPADWSTASSATVSLIASDNMTGVRATYFRLNGSDTTTYTRPLAISAEGTNELEYWSVDNGGAIEAPTSAHVRIDYTPPTSTHDAPSGWSNAPVRLSIAAEDNASGVARTHYSLDDSHPSIEVTGPIEVLREGQSTLKFFSVDVAGNTENLRVVPIRIDTVPPATEIDVAEGWSASPRQLSFSATDDGSGVGRTYYSLDGSYPSIEVTGSIALSTEGTVTLNYYSVDEAGNKESPKTRVIRLDGTAPVTSSTVLPSYTATAHIAFSASDTGSGVERTEYRLNGGDWTVGTSTIVASGGAHTVSYRSVDKVGNVEELRTANFKITKRIEQTDPAIAYRGTWPTVNHASLSGGSHRYTITDGAYTTIAFNGTQLDWIGSKAASYGIARVSVDGQAPMTVDLYSPTTAFQQVVYSTGKLEPGDHVLRIEYTGSRNASATGFTVGIDAVAVTGELLVDNMAPTTVTNVSSDWYTSPVSMTIAGFDNLVGIETTKYRVNGGTTYTYANPLTISAEGTTTVDFWSTDRMGNVETTKTAVVRVDTLAPVTTANVATAYTTTATITFTPNETVSGVNKTQYRLDGGNWTEGKSVSVGSLGPHTIEWRSTDNAGNVESTKTASFAVLKRFEQTDPLIGLVGTWSNVSHSSLSDGNYSYSAAAGSYVEFTFTGTRIDWVTSKSNSNGIARVVLDGGSPSTVDLYAPSAAFQQRVWSSGTLEAGTHTVRIEFTGTKNAASTGYNVGLDALDIAGSLTGRRYEQTEPKLAYAGAWASGNHASLSGGSFTYTFTTGSAVDIAFVGTKLDWITSKNLGYGIAKVTLDKGTPVYVDLYSNSAKFQQLVWSTGDLAYGAHTLRIEHTGTRNASATGNSIGIDALEVRGVLVDPVRSTRHEQLDSKIAHTGTWNPVSNASMSGGSHSFTNVSGSAVDISFNGTRMDWIGSKSPSHGIAKVTLDNNPPVYVDQYSASGLFQQVIWSTGDLPDGPHTLRIEYTGTKSAAASGTNVSIDALEVFGTLTQATAKPSVVRYDQTNSLVAYGGTWSTVNNSSLYGGSFAYATTPGTSANIAFTGTSVDLITSRNVNYGIAKVTLDNQPPVYVDLYASSPQFQQKVWSSGTLAAGAHTLKIEYTGTKAAAATGYVVPIDAVDINGTLTQATAVPTVTRIEQTDNRLSFSAGWTSVNNASLSGGSFTFSPVASETVEVKFSGTRLDWIGSKSTSYGIAQVSVDGGTPVEVDLYSATPAFRQQLWSSGELADGPHTVRISVTGSKATASTGFNVNVDAFDVLGTIVQAP